MSKFFDSFEPYNLPAFERGVRLPEVHVPNEDLALLKLGECSNLDYLKKLCWTKCCEKIASGQIKQSKEDCAKRLKMEFDVFVKTGVIDYILLLLNIFGWCDKNDIPRGVARGSAAGSFALFCLDLIRINALDHGLHFTRFLNEARVKPKTIDGVLYVDGSKTADFDGDISYLHRSRVLQHIDDEYRGRTAKISTVQYLTGKMAVKEALKSYLEYSEEEAREVTNNIEALFGKVQTISEAYEKSPKFKEFADENPKVIAIARKMEGLINAFGVHASGILISHSDIQQLIPLELSSNDKSLSIVSGYAMEHALTVIAKIDALGLRTADLIDLVCKKVGIKSGDINVNDPSIYAFYEKSSDFYGLFQIEDGLTKQVIRRVKPKNIDQLAACISISRPGSLRYIDDYVKFVQTGERKAIHPLVDDLLKPTGNLILYQEQINTICQSVYGMSATDADEVRYAIGKKKREEMKKWEPVIYTAGETRNIPIEVTKWFWDTCNASADYLFNENHCLSYSYITAYTTYLKANHPIFFYWACLELASAETKPHDCIAIIEAEMRHAGYQLLPPDLSASGLGFKIVSDKSLRYGLGLIRGIAESSMKKVEIFCSNNGIKKTNNKFEMFQGIKNGGLNIGIGSALVQSGCLSGHDVYYTKTGERYHSRSRLVLELQTWNILTDKEKAHCLAIYDHPNIKGDVLAAIKYLAEELKDTKGKNIISASRFETIKKKYEPYKQIYLQNSRNEALACFFYEKRVLGYSHSQSLSSIFSEHTDGLISIAQASNLPSEISCRVIGFVENDSVFISKTKAGNRMFKMDIADETGSITVRMFNDTIDLTEQQNGRLPEDGDLCIINGKKMDGNTLFTKAGPDGVHIGIQSAKVFTRLSELKDSKKTKEETKS